MTTIHVLDFQVLTSFLLHCESLVYVKSFIHPNCVLCMVWYVILFLSSYLLKVFKKKQESFEVECCPSGGEYNTYKTT